MEPTKDELHPQKYSTKLRRFTTTIIISSKLLLMQDRVLRSLQNYGKTAFEATYGKTAFEAVFGQPLWFIQNLYVLVHT